jgi:hypothetical protein
MSEPVTIPAPSEIAKRIDACRAELAALKRLHRLACAAKQAREAAERPPLQREEAVHAR